jgi:hypothetical protein
MKAHLRDVAALLCIRVQDLSNEAIGRSGDNKPPLDVVKSRFSLERMHG